MIIKTKEKYQNLTGITNKNTSQLKMFNILKDLEKVEYFANIFRSYILNDAHIDDYRYYIQHDVTNTDGGDTISNQYYGTPKLGWILAAINNVVNPFEELTEGDVVKVLREQYTYKIIKDSNNLGKL